MCQATKKQTRLDSNSAELRLASGLGGSATRFFPFDLPALAFVDQYKRSQQGKKHRM